MGLEKKKIGIIASAVCLVGASTIGYSLADNKAASSATRNFSVTIPTAIPMMQDSTGNTRIAKNLPIENKGDDSVVIKTLTVKPASGFSLSDAGSSLPDNSFNISVDGVYASASGGVVNGKQPVINKGQRAELPLAVKAGKLGEKGHRNIGTLEYEFAWEIQGVRVKSEPTKKDYNEGDAFSKDGLAIETIRGDGKPGTEIRADSIVIKDGDRLTKGQSTVTAEVTVNGQKHTIEIGGLTVKEKAKVVGIEVVKNPDKMEYNEGDRLVLDGMIVKTKLSDGSTGEEIPIGDITVTDVSGDLTIDTTSFGISVNIGGQTYSERIDGLVVIPVVAKQVDRNKMNSALSALSGKITFVKTAYTGDTSNTRLVRDISLRSAPGTVYAVLDGNNATVYAAGGIRGIDSVPYSLDTYSKYNGMFQDYACSEMDISGIDMSNVEHTSGMFYNTSNMKKLTLNGVKFGKVKRAHAMFASSGIENINLKDFNFSDSLEHMSNMFAKSGLKSFSMGGISLNSNLSMFDMLRECKSLTTANFDNIYLPNTTIVHGLMRGCESLRTVSMKNAELGYKADLSSICTRCTNLVRFDTAGSNISVGKSVNTFYDCTQLSIADLSGLNMVMNPTTSNHPTGSVTTYYTEDMFKGCGSLAQVKVKTASDKNKIEKSRNFPTHGVRVVVG